VAFSPDGQLFVTGCGEPWGLHATGQEARLRKRATGELVGAPLPHRGAVLAAAFSPDGKLVLTGSSDGVARLWDVASGKAVGQPMAHRGPVTAVAFGGDGRTALTGSRDGTARLWDATSGRSLGPPLTHLGQVTFTSFSPDGQGVLTSGSGSEEFLQRWEAPVAPLAGASAQIQRWAEVLTGLELESDTVVGTLSRQAWNERRQRLRELGGPPLP
jgi:hypothetical protein